MLAAGPVEAQRDFGDWEPTSTRAAETILDSQVARDRRVTLLTILNLNPREIRVTGADTAVAVGDTVQLYAAVL